MEEWIPIAKQNFDWITFVFMLNFLLIVFIKLRHELQFFSFLRLIDTVTYFNSYTEKYGVFNGFISISMLFSSLTLSMFSVYFLQHFFEVSLDFSLFMLVFIGLLATILLRSFFIQFVASVLGINEFIRSFQFRNCTYIFRLCIFLNTGLVFYHFGLSQSFLVFKFLFISGLFAYLASQAMVIRQLFSTINSEGLYFILYLCTLKMSPWILLYHGIKRLYE